MSWNLPISVEIDGTEYLIRNKCDYRVVLDVIKALNDEDLDMQYRIICALFIFYGNDELNTQEKVLKAFRTKENTQIAIDEMTKIISLGEEKEQDDKPQIMDWEHDFPHIAAPISRVLGYSVRDTNHCTHWFDFMGAYHEIGDCFWSSVISIRSKRIKGKKLEQQEREFYNENKHLIDLPKTLTAEEQEWLDSDW